MLEFSANDTCALNENEQKRRSNLVQQVYVEYLVKPSWKRWLSLVRTSPEHLMKRSCCICNLYPCHPSSWYRGNHFSVQCIPIITGNWDAVLTSGASCREYQEGCWILKEPSAGRKGEPSFPAGSSGSCPLWKVLPEWRSFDLYLWNQGWSGRSP